MLVFNTKLVEVVLKLFSEHFHRRHVGKQDGLHNTFAYQLNLCRLEFTGEEVILIAVKQLHCSGRMEVFLHVVLAVHLEEW